MLIRFWQFGRPYLWTYVAGFVLLLGTNALGLWIPWLLRDAINAMERGAALGVVATLAGGMIAIALAQSVVRTISRLTILGAARRIVFEIRNAFFGHLQRLGASFYDTHRTGDIMSRGVNDLQILQGFYAPGIMNLFNTAIVYVAVLVLLLRLDVQLTLISLMLYPILMLGVNRLARRIYSRSKAVQEQLAAISNRAQENLSGIQQVKAYAQEDREIAAFSDLCAEFRRRQLSMTVIRGSMMSVIGIFSGAATLIVLFVGGQHVIQGRIGFGDFVAFNAYLALLARPTIALGWIINVFQRAAGAMQRVDEFLRVQPDVPPPVDEAEGEPAGPPVDGDIEVRGLTFAYGDHGSQGRDALPTGAYGGSPRDPVPHGDDHQRPRASNHSLRDVSLNIPRGSRVALVGPVGSGKSTLVNLLARVYPVPRGTISIGGTDINDIPVARLRRSLGYVPQEAFLFSRSIRENVAFRDPDADDAEVARAIRMSQLASDLELFPRGLDTVVGERGFTLSGGQRQRATLARAVIGDPPILILDDALSSVDADTERAILDEFLNGARDRTVIFISHRLSTLAGMDRIVVLDDGQVVEQGTHGELVERDGVYARLFRRQQLEERLDAQ